ncbi:SlyX family protein [Aporhodopirellula aestuarii]|uniref:SlyX family protein n=1 Tax=Aporhodopirellula aestuarii TaxID=2950107 RepID=A0ABT0U2Q1_9BACT|nr:SlyX family protein [Aporhodopirellula aestuarii]MCM2371176.1 SlyX family protein [Aporhodopirellula aestuarii]
MPDSPNERITQLEIQLAHTQRTCEQLNEIVTKLSLDAQSRDRMLQRLLDQVKDFKNKLDAGGGVSLEDEKPPHY